MSSVVGNPGLHAGEDVNTAPGRENDLVRRTQRLEFILRRACWCGRVTIHDVQEAFGVTRQEALADLAEAVRSWVVTGPNGGTQQILTREKNAVIPVYPLRLHKEASSARMVQLLAARAPFPVTGLRSNEIDVFFPANRANMIDQEVLFVMMQAVTDKSEYSIVLRPVIIEYVGVTSRQRKILPVMLEFDSTQTRVYAHDLEAKGYPVKAFALVMIKSARFSDEDLPTDLVVKGISNYRRARFRLALNRKN